MCCCLYVILTSGLVRLEVSASWYCVLVQESTVLRPGIFHSNFCIINAIFRYFPPVLWTLISPFVQFIPFIQLHTGASKIPLRVTVFVTIVMNCWCCWRTFLRRSTISHKIELTSSQFVLFPATLVGTTLEQESNNQVWLKLVI